MELRKYRPQDCAEMARLFYVTVHTVNAADYTEEQLDAWADGQVDLEKWNASFLEHDTLVAVEGETIVGFGDMDSTGYLDRLYVHKDHQKKGIATAICDRLERAHRKRAVFLTERNGTARQGEGERTELTFTTHASITARPFFEKRGYVVKKEQQVERRANREAESRAACPAACGAESRGACGASCSGILLTNFVMERTEDLELILLTKEKKNELKACAKILMESFAHAWNTEKEAEETLRETLESGVLIAVCREKKAAGFVGAHPEYPFGWELHPLAVAPGERGMGLGSLLVARIEREAARAGALVMYLGTDDEDGLTSLSEGDLFENTLEKMKEIRNRAGHPYEFYQKCGYQIVGVLPDVNGPGKPDIFMAKRLAAPSGRPGKGPDLQKTGKQESGGKCENPEE